LKITPDTNVLLRAVVKDDPHQGRAAKAILESADVVALTLPALCEFVWMMSRGYEIAAVEIAEAVRRLVDSVNVVVNRAAVEAGLEMLEKGEDFAGGVLAYEGRWLGGETFVSFDKSAVQLLAAQGKKSLVPT
jgi:predicted nucleic-acid-binding protein